MVFFAAAAWPFFRRISMAFSITPFASTSAARQSAKPAPVRSRSSLTSFAGISIAVGCVLILFFSLLIGNFSFGALSHKNGPHRFARRGPHKIPPAQIALAFFLVVGRNSGFRRLRGVRGGFRGGPHLSPLPPFVL